jgi:hypothetical protein
VPFTEDDEREAHVENLHMDTEYKRGLIQYEPWKLILATAGASTAIILTLLAVATFIAAHLIH